VNDGEADMNRNTLSTRLKNKRGTVTVMVALLLIVIIGFAAFAVDVGYMMVRRNELQNIADTAALAATGELGALYENMDYTVALTYEPAIGPLLAKAQQVADATGVSNVIISGSDFKLGKWNPATHKFTPTSIGPTAVQVYARKDNTANGPFSTLLAGVVGISSFDVSAKATASLTSLLITPEGGLPLPVGISLHWFSDPEVYCNNPIKMYPTNTPEGCAAWNVYDQSPHSSDLLQRTLGGLNDGSYQSPQTLAGITQYNFTGGTDASAIFNTHNGKGNIIDLFNTMKVKNDGVLDKDTDSNTWTTAVPVYDSPDCSNPSGYVPIVGFSTIVITSVSDTPEKTIWAKVVCDSIVSGSGGNGVITGTMGHIPNLVQ
jgi:hypothetical protein